MSFINSRLRRLEQRARGGNCPECGLPPNGPRRIVISDSEFPDPRFPEDPDECCPECGRPLWTVIKVVYDDEEGGGATVDG
jgi:hypothetical protein